MCISDFSRLPKIGCALIRVFPAFHCLKLMVTIVLALVCNEDGPDIPKNNHTYAKEILKDIGTEQSPSMQPKQ